jgi:ketosteroid isomerase-like protein
MPVMTDVTEQSVHRVLDEWADALARGDGDRLLTMMSASLVHTDPLGAVHTRDEVIAGLRGANGAGDLEVSKDDIRVQLYGGTAVVTGRTTVVQRLSGQVRQGRFRFTDVLIHDGRQWSIVATHTTGIAEPRG